MVKSILQLEPYKSEIPNTYRTVFKTGHGRVIFLALSSEEKMYTVQDCFYIDRNRGCTGDARYSAIPKKLRTVRFPADDLLTVIGNELDKKFYGVEYTASDTEEATTEDFICLWERKTNNRYRFLIMVGNGALYNGLPVSLRTRLKNKLHRSVYVELEYYKEGIGVVKKCCYYDRKYKQQGKQVTPPMLLNCFFPYTKEGILNLLNNEICCDFTHMLITDGIDPNSDKHRSAVLYKEACEHDKRQE